MSVAEKPIVESVPRKTNNLVLPSLLGAVLVALGAWVVLAGIPLFWGRVLNVPTLTNEFLSSALLLIVVVAAAIGLGFLGLKAEKAFYQKGLREGAILGALFLYLLGSGLIVLAIIYLVVVLLIYLLSSAPNFAGFLGNISDAGWFQASGFKSNQGVRIRRLTVIALLVVGFWGIVTSISHRGFGMETSSRPNTWAVSIPFTGYTESHVITNVSGTVVERKAKVKEESPVSADDVLIVVQPDNSDKPRQIKAGRSGTIQTVNKKLIQDARVEETDVLVALDVVHDPYALPFIFKAHMVVPILLSMALVWLAWRIVNIPSFADFLIATEAEMNKVSWTTRRRLFQDTIVVLVTMFIMTAFLFIIDIVWIKVLSWEPIGVLQYDTREAKQRQEKESQW